MKQLAFHRLLEADRAVQAFLGCLMFLFLSSTDVEQKLLKPNSSTSVQNLLQPFAQIREKKKTKLAVLDNNVTF